MGNKKEGSIKNLIIVSITLILILIPTILALSFSDLLNSLANSNSESNPENPETNLDSVKIDKNSLDVNKDSRLDLSDMDIINCHREEICDESNDWCDNSDVNRDGRANKLDLYSVAVNIGAVAEK